MYGKSPEEIEDAIKIFYDQLKHYEAKEITTAFRIWLSEGRQMPTVADIRHIILSGKPMQDYTPPTGRTNFPDNDGIKAVEDIVKGIRQNLQPDTQEDKERRWKQDYNHFDKLTDDQKKEHMRNLKNVKPHGHASADNT